ncbi:MAG: hypothetical protein VX681_04185 [Myxococcota bacterium]|nr:hypothetical protein [Myxococcota bacterium]
MSGHGTPRAQTIVAALAAIAVLAPVLVLAAAPTRTNDLWFHLAAGRSYAAEGPWPGADPLLHTAHEDAPVQHEWLFGVVVHALHTTTGFAGLRVVHALAVLGTATLAFACFRRAGAGPAVAFAGTTAFLVLGWWRLIQLRPDLVSIPATLACYALLLADDEPPPRRNIAAAVAIALGWANMHSLFALGPALVVTGLLAIALRSLLARGWITGDAARARTLAATGIAMLGAAALNPRGFAQHLTFFTSSSNTAIWQISDEWSHFDPLHWPDAGAVLSPLAWLLANALIVGSLALAAARLLACVRAEVADRPAAIRRLDAVHLGLAAAGSVALLVSIRFLWMGIFPLLFLARSLPAASQRAGWGGALGACILAAALPGWGGLGEHQRTLPDNLANYFGWRFDARALQPRGVRFLIDSGVSGNLFNRYTHGGFIGYWLAPRVRTFVDGRTEHYPADVLDDYFRISHQLEVRPGESALEALDRREIDLYFGVGVPVEGQPIYTTARLDRTPGWIQISRSVDHSVFLRVNQRNRANLDRVAAYYANAGVPFDRESGFDPLIAARTRPDWAIEQGIVPPDYSQLLTARGSEDPQARAPALDRLGLMLYLLGAYEAQIALDRELVGMSRRAIEPRRRLVHSLLRLGRDGEAALQVSEIASVTGGGSPTTELLRLVKQVEQLRIDPHPIPPEAAINAVPAVDRPTLVRFFSRAPLRPTEFPESRGG